MTTANRDVHDALASISENYEVRGPLHVMPPHAVYEVAVDGRRAVCKAARGELADPAMEARIVEFLDRETDVPVPRILAVGSDFFVAEWRGGLPDDPEIDESRAQVMGEGLATLHEETAGEFESTGFLHAEDESLALELARDSWHETVCDLLEVRREYLVGVGYEDAANEAISLLRDHPELLAGAGEPVLAHGNYLPEHVGVEDSDADGDHDGDVTCIVDFEHALVAPGEYDYWRTALPLFKGPGRVSEAYREAFRAGYESVRSLPEGFDRREKVYTIVNSVSYLRSLHVQKQQTGQQKARTARAMREYVFETAAELREEVAE